VCRGTLVCREKFEKCRKIILRKSKFKVLPKICLIVKMPDQPEVPIPEVAIKSSSLKQNDAKFVKIQFNSYSNMRQNNRDRLETIIASKNNTIKIKN
jgi:hypothetical protein